MRKAISFFRSLVVQRISKLPSKTLLWIWAERDMRRLSTDKEIGLDAACGRMNNRHLFLTKKYVGLDRSEELIKEGLEKYPDAIPILSNLEDIDNLKADICLCVQTIGFNVHFDTEHTIEVVDKLVSAVKPKGQLVFNIGSRQTEARIVEPQIDQILSGKFRKVKKLPYGAFSFKTNKYISLFLAYLMNFLPLFRTVGGHKLLYYVCTDRKTSP